MFSPVATLREQWERCKREVCGGVYDVVRCVEVCMMSKGVSDEERCVEVCMMWRGVERCV